MKKIHYVLLGVVLAFVICIAVGLFMYFKPHKNISESKPDIILKASELFKAFETNETDATKKFVTGDPTIQVLGIVDEINKNQDTTATIILRNVAEYNGCITCTIDKSQFTKLDKFQKGTPIIIKGQCSGAQELVEKEIVMIRCIIVEK